MKKQNSKYYIILLLIILFIAPGLLAYVVYRHPAWLHAPRLNKGLLLAEPIQLLSVKEKNKWRIIFWTPELCGQKCLSQIDTLARVRLALGRRLYQVGQKLLVDKARVDQLAPISNELKAKGFDINPLSIEDKEKLTKLGNLSQIYIMNPDNYLILSYKSGVNPNDIYKDLKLLLNVTELKKG